MNFTQFIASLLYEAVIAHCAESMDTDGGARMKQYEEVRWQLLDIVEIRPQSWFAQYVLRA